jgi:hypothetical protein
MHKPRFGGAFVFSARRQEDVDNVKAALAAHAKLHLDSLRLRPSDQFAGRCLAILLPLTLGTACETMLADETYELGTAAAKSTFLDGRTFTTPARTCLLIADFVTPREVREVGE